MLTKIQKWGNSQGLRLPKDLLRDTGLGIGSEVEVVIEGDTILIKPVKKIRGKYRLDDLVKRIPKDTRSGKQLTYGVCHG